MTTRVASFVQASVLLFRCRRFFFPWVSPSWLAAIRWQCWTYRCHHGQGRIRFNDPTLEYEMLMYGNNSGGQSTITKSLPSKVARLADDRRRPASEARYVGVEGGR
ncbi:hypothetical protein JMJ77_0010402 [Colletotrichum scovillei]|uniref:Uncharacterized protein n=1 Tax=Colletotrichum scovillei TaxID=1209932 RepID=A0A9P7QTJ3_9PEZI|nr:hypothetical protein JMJ78_0011804 [Colletotrichum scovillei]KAG7042302.1 hypothetical protein JMJ77_0010402 [Colletotrichum scovillei]KAG7062336.1 hypothetical protein JMJ76_0006611 [Colletotrichum scovillei]